MLVYPTLHYQNGGLEYNSRGETSIPGFFVSGEVGGGVHGENRLMGNSLLDVCVFGRIAGFNAALYVKEKVKDGRLTLDHVRRYHKRIGKRQGLLPIGSPRCFFLITPIPRFGSVN